MKFLPRLKNKNLYLIFVIMAFGFVLRIININWDQGLSMHPDERAIIMFVINLKIPLSLGEFFSPQSPLNPHFFAYGNFPLYLLKFSGEIAKYIDPILNQYGGIQIVGRLISALVDAGTIFLIYQIIKKFGNSRIALFASLSYSLFVFPIQSSHFYTVDILLTFFILLTLDRCIHYFESKNIRNLLFLSFAFSLATSTKISALVLLFPIFLTFVFVFFKFTSIKNFFSSLKNAYKPTFLFSIIILIASFILFNFFFQPYAFIDYESFISRTLYESQMTRDPYVFPYTLQYVGKIPYLYEIKNIALWGIGPWMFGLLLLGILLLMKIHKRTVNNKTIIIASFTMVYFALVGTFAVGWMRYMLPLYPIIAMIVGYALYFLILKVRALRAKGGKYLLFGLITLLQIYWTFTFMSIYIRPNTRMQASDWINTNIPAGKIISTEHWDDRLPFSGQEKYIFQELPLYELPDDAKKWETIQTALDRTDYIILASNRLSTPLQKLSDCNRYKKCYPMTARYYNNLFSGKSGFEKIAEFKSYPALPILNITIPDQTADESFTVYDHPKVIIFKKNDK